MSIVSKRLRDSARGQPCMFRLPYVCNGDPATTVFCHGPDESKAMGCKAHDFIGSFGCSACHEAMDQRRQIDPISWEVAWRTAMVRTWTWWIEHGYIRIVGDDEERKPRGKKLSKVMQRPDGFRR